MKKQHQPKLRPILFSTPMVQAILEGRKTQTRRIIKDDEAAMQYLKAGMTPEFVASEAYALCRYGAPNDVLWVRESFYEPMFEGLNGKYYFRADLASQGWDFKWKPSIHMPFEAARIFLRIKSNKVEELQSITDEDAIAEGIANSVDPVASFFHLWTDINGADSLKKNPWLWGIEFERITKEQAMREVGHA